ncbi:MAG: cytochrome c3 family protein [Nitrospirota bacterium]
MIILGPGETDTSPKDNLLKSSCLGCHSKTDGITWQDNVTKAPIVFNTSPPQYGASSDGGTTYQGLAAGNFYWVQTEDTKGHNIFALSNPESTLTVAPGDTVGSCGGVNSCHENIHGATGPPYFGFVSSRQGCTKCHMVGVDPGTPKGYHHKDDTGPLIDSASEGWYRFLDGHQSGAGLGVTGIEDDDWEQESSIDHNEYLGYSGTKTSGGGFSALGNTMTAYCTGCHRNFHIEDDATSGSPWIRHPSDLVIPNSGEYAKAFNAVGGVGTYDSLVPVARPNLTGWTGSSNAVNLNTDMVMCLSCHKAHASPYFKMMRWDYKGWPGTGDNYCAMCHTSKQ